MIIESKKTKSFSTMIKNDEGVEICALNGDISENNPLGNTSMYVYNKEEFKKNVTEINAEYSKFKKKVEEEALADLTEETEE